MKISNLPDKDLCLKYGQTLMDFANAKSTDDAISLLFQNLHIVYELSDEYLKIAKTKFPLMSSIKKLSEEKSLYVKNIIPLSELSAQISLYMFETYSFRLISIDINDSCLGVIDFKNIDIELKNFKYPCQKETIKYIQKYGRFGKNYIYLRETNRIIIIDNLKVNLGREKGGYLIEEVHKRIMFADLNKKKIS